MDIDGLPLIGSGVDYTQVEAINQKRTLAFINHFITSTVSFLNKFSRSCEIRLQECESKIQKLESALLILESKLSSIPGLEVTNMNMEVDRPPTLSETEVPKEALPVVTEIEPPASNKAETTETPNMIPISKHPTFKKFFRMLHFGVPEPAVRLKMTQEDLDPDVLKNPNQLVPAQNKTDATLSDTESSLQPED